MSRTKTMAAFIALLSLAAGLTHSYGDVKQVWVFYLSFWAGPQTWHWNDAVLTDHPLLGLYNSKLPDVAAAQINQAIGAGIDAFIVNWFGLEDTVTTTPALNNLLDRAAEQDFSIGVAVDLYPEAFNRQREGLVESLRWLVQDRARHPAYLRYEGKPVIFFAFQHRADFTAEDWQVIRKEVDPNHDTIWLAEGLSACCLYGGAMDGMYAFNMAWANGDRNFYVAERNIVYEQGGTVYIPAISPGWDEDAIAQLTGRRRPTSPRDRDEGHFLEAAWQGALAAQTDVILVVSWNEFIENSHIEPSDLYGTQSLDTLRRLITDWSGRTPRLTTGVPSTYVIQTLQEVEVLAAPRWDAAIIGTLMPGEPYPLLGEDNGLYVLDFGGREGYVSALKVHIITLKPAREGKCLTLSHCRVFPA